MFETIDRNGYALNHEISNQKFQLMNLISETLEIAKHKKDLIMEIEMEMMKNQKNEQFKFINNITNMQQDIEMIAKFDNIEDYH